MTYTAEQRQTLREADQIKRDVRKAKKKARPPSEKATRGRDLDKGFIAYLRRQPCEARSLGGCSGRMDPAHIRFNDGPDRQNPGAGRKNHDRHANPLCRHHHQHDQHRGAERFFWERIGKDAYATAAEHYATYKGREYLAARG